MSTEEPSDRLREARINAGFTSTAEAARRFGWNENTYKSHENGKRGIPRRSVERYARYFKVDPEWIMFGDAGRPKDDTERRFLAKLRRASPLHRELAERVLDLDGIETDKG